MKNEKVAKGRIIGLAGPCSSEISVDVCHPFFCQSPLSKEVCLLMCVVLLSFNLVCVSVDYASCSVSPFCLTINAVNPQAD